MKQTRWLLVLLAALGCSIAREAPAGSQTHFLRACSASCAAPYTCLCGVCSLSCDDDTACDTHASSAACFDPVAELSCDDAPRMCDVECKRDGECSSLGTGFRCEAGRCRGSAVVSAPTMVADASVPNPSTPDAGKDPTKPADVPATTDASTPCPNSPIDKLDLLFMVDNSNSMADEQGSLSAQFPKLIKALTTGRRFDGDPNPFPAVKDLHVGIVSSDMGIPGVNFGANTNCSPDGGDDGRLQHIAHGAGCDSSYPAFLSYDTLTGDSAKFASDFACIAALGTSGCGFEQQLEAPLKALWPSVFKDAKGQTVTPNPILFLSTMSQGVLGHGDVPVAQGGNAGFLRNDPTSLSAIEVVVVTDEEDCSSRTTEHLKPRDQYPMDSPYFNQDLNLRCFYNSNLLYDVANRYLKGFQLLRPGHEDMVLFAAIAGVPTDLVSKDVLDATDFSNDAARNKFYDNILNDDRMREEVDPSSNPDQGTGNLRPSCVRTDTHGNLTTASPPRRIATLAKLFGDNGMIQSICQDDFTPAVDAIINLTANRLQHGASCAH